MCCYAANCWQRVRLNRQASRGTTGIRINLKPTG
jgi:hypothetical protein